MAHRGVRLELVACIEEMLERGVLPEIPIQGSVGASGDLAPLAHLAAVMIGEGYRVLRRAPNAGPGPRSRRPESRPLTLGPKEGLALLNGTQFSTACALAALFDAWRAAESAVAISALSTDAVMGSTEPLLAEIHALRGHRGQCETAAMARALLAGSEIRESHRDNDIRVQDPYCIRCQPQVLGACIDLFRQAARTLRIEANGATDNPLVLMEDRPHRLRRQLPRRAGSRSPPTRRPWPFSETGSIAQRRVAVLVDPGALLRPVPRSSRRTPAPIRG